MGGICPPTPGCLSFPCYSGCFRREGRKSHLNTVHNLVADSFCLQMSGCWVSPWILDSGAPPSAEECLLACPFPCSLLGDVFEPGSSSVTCPGIQLDDEEPSPAHHQIQEEQGSPFPRCLLPLPLWAAPAVLLSHLSRKDWTVSLLKYAHQCQGMALSAPGAPGCALLNPVSIF